MSDRRASPLPLRTPSSHGAQHSAIPVRSSLRYLTSISLPLFVIWLPALAAALYTKWQLLDHEGFRCVGRYQGRIEIANSDSRAYLFSFPERLSFFRWDLLTGTIVAPAVLLVLLFWLRPRWRIWLAAGVAVLTIALLIVQMHGHWVVGHFQNWQLWRDAVQWGLMHPDDAREYGSGRIITKVVAACAALGLLAFCVNWAGRFSRRRWLIQRIGGGLWLLLLLTTGIAWAVPIVSTVYHRDIVFLCARAVLGTTDVDLTRYADLASGPLMEKWRAISHTPNPKPQPEYFGAAAGSDVICLVMETAPQRCLDVTGSMAQTPNMRLLRQHSFVAAQHVSAYPYTRWAVLALTTSWYPTEVAFFNGEGAGHHVPGFLHSLSAIGYTTAAYKPYTDSAEDELLNQCEGMASTQYGDARPTLGEAHDQLSWQTKVELDHSALDKLKHDIAGWIAHDQRYAALFFPQIGHAPWPDVIVDGKPHTVVERGAAVIALQDQWLGEIIEQLRQAGRLEHTIIMVCGDHGVRTRREDPDFAGGIISDYSFRVPFLLYAPQVLAQPDILNYTTSHIDLGPSVLDLLGVRDGRQFELGAPLWDRRLSQRTVYLWAGVYLGADGFYDGHRYGMWQHVSQMATSSPTFDFTSAQPMPPGTPGHSAIVETLTDAMAIQYRVTRLGMK